MARPATQPNFENCSLDELETAARAAPTLASHMRMMMILAVGKGFTLAQVSQLYGRTRRTLQEHVRRFNACGIDGLIEKKSTGRRRKISLEKTAQYRELLEKPQLAQHVHWTAKKFHGHLNKELDEEVGYSTVVRWIHEQGFRLKVPQPWPDRQDEQARKAFVQRVGTWLCDEQIDLWYQDEMGVEGDPRPRRRWIKKGQKGRVTRNGDHTRMNVSGMVCPRTGQFFALELSHSDTEMFQVLLNEANKHIQLQRPRNLLIMDNASWHKSKSLDWGGFEPVYLPSYSPDLNPIERLWLLVKTEWFSDFVAKTREALMDRLDKALLWVINRTECNKQTCAIKKNI